MADDRANNPARRPEVSEKYQGLADKLTEVGAENVSSVARPSSHDGTFGSNKWDFGGGRHRIEKRTEEEKGPRTMTKFDKNNKYHVAMLKSAGAGKDETTEGMMIHPGGHFSFPKKEAPAKTEGKAAPKKAVAPKAEASKKEAPKKKVSNLEKVRAREAAAKASGKIKDKTTDTKDE